MGVLCTLRPVSTKPPSANKRRGGCDARPVFQNQTSTIMKEYRTYSEVVAAAEEDGMTVEEFFFSLPAEYFEHTDWTK